MLKNKTAFTMIEAIMVIIVMGILAAIAIPRLENDTTQEAADQILSDIRYTQHLALTDDVTNPNSGNWQRAFWSINFGTCSGNTGQYYMVGSDKDYGGGIDKVSESALDPLTGKPMFWVGTSSCSNGGDGTVSDKIFITKKFGIDAVNFTACNNVKHIGFDHLGRLHQSFTTSGSPDYSTVLNAPCVIGFQRDGVNLFSIQINPETGYAFLVGQPNQ